MAGGFPAGSWELLLMTGMPVLDVVLIVLFVGAVLTGGLLLALWATR